jgi:hypothetical protein
MPITRRPDFCRKPDSGFLTALQENGKEINFDYEFCELSLNRSPHRASLRYRKNGADISPVAR